MSSIVPQFSADLPPCHDVTLKCCASGNDLCITVAAADKPSRAAAHCILVLDISGSMNSEASLPNPNANPNEAQVIFSRLDLAKHSSKVIIEVLDACDFVTVISFGSNARIELPKTAMNADGKTRAQTVIDALTTSGTTNLIDAMAMTLEQALADTQCSNLHIMLLTDGEPDRSPEVLGAFQTNLLPLEAARAQGRHHGVCLSTFGFGFAMNSALLLEMSRVGHGMFSYIPDASMIGTVFCNFIANALCVVHSVIDVEVELTGAEFNTLDQACKTQSGYTMNEGSRSKLSFSVAGLQVGQPKSFLFAKQASGSFSVRAVAVVDGASAVAVSVTDPEPIFPLLTEQRALVTYLEAVSTLDAARVASLPALLPPSATSDFIGALHRDLVSSNAQEGQVTLGLSNADFKSKWGDHYTRSLLCAHRLQQCHNYKDPSVQLYGGALFKSIVDTADAAFCTLPAPKGRVVQPHTQQYGYQQQSGGSSASSYSAPAPAPAVDMSRFMDRYGGCFAPQSPVALADGTTTSIECLRPGMRVLGGARVEHVVRINYDAVVPMVALPGAAGCGVTLVTPWHPVRVAGNWTFPSLIVAPCPLYMDCVYNIVLSSDHVICINGLDFITLGHGITSHPVLSHAFFGTQAVVRALRSKHASSGVVVITNGFCRDPLTGLVCGFADHLQAAALVPVTRPQLQQHAAQECF